MKLIILKLFGWKIDSKCAHGGVFVKRRFDFNKLELSNCKFVYYDFFTVNQAFRYQFKYLPFILLTISIIIFHYFQH
jgi:hypothetical protein